MQSNIRPQYKTPDGRRQTTKQGFPTKRSYQNVGESAWGKQRRVGL